MASGNLLTLDLWIWYWIWTYRSWSFSSDNWRFHNGSRYKIDSSLLNNSLRSSALHRFHINLPILNLFPTLAVGCNKLLSGDRYLVQCTIVRGGCSRLGPSSSQILTKVSWNAEIHLLLFIAPHIQNELLPPFFACLLRPKMPLHVLKSLPQHPRHFTLPYCHHLFRAVCSGREEELEMVTFLYPPANSYLFPAQDMSHIVHIVGGCNQVSLHRSQDLPSLEYFDRDGLMLGNHALQGKEPVWVHSMVKVVAVSQQC